MSQFVNNASHPAENATPDEIYERIMDQSIFAGAREGKYEILEGLPSARISFSDKQDMLEWTPLHIACLFGQKRFVEMFLEKFPDFLLLVNPNHCNVLHLASSNGQLEMVRLILLKSQTVHRRKLCMKRDKEGRIPLHHSVINGSADVAEELLEACPQSILEVTDQKETVFHLAVKNKVSPDELFLSLYKLGGCYTGYLLNSADREGNTVLHLAVVRKQNKIVKHLTKFEVNAVNSNGHTPLDVLVFDPMNTIDRDIENSIKSSGGKGLNESYEKAENLKTISSGLFVMASLIAAVCCQLAIHLLDSSAKLAQKGDIMFWVGSALLTSLCLIATLSFPIKANVYKWFFVRLFAYNTAVAFTIPFLELGFPWIDERLSPFITLIVFPLLLVFVLLEFIPVCSVTYHSLHQLVTWIWLWPVRWIRKRLVPRNQRLV